MKNPFEYGGVVGAEAFCNRAKELAELLRSIENSETLFIYSERRFGKTSLVRLALNKLPRKQFLSAYVDLWPTDGPGSFATATAKAIAESMGTAAEKLLTVARRLFGRLAPSITADDEGKPKVTFGVLTSLEAGPELEEVLAAPARIAAEGKRKVVIVFDECQQLLEYGSDLVERRLRSAIQNHRNVSYIFLGSRRHLIQKMFLDKSRPMYRAGGHYPLGPIREEDWLPFIKKRFFDAKKQIPDDRIRSVCRLTEGHPFYTQHFCHVLWDECAEHTVVSDEMVQSAVGIVLDRESYAYTTLWESLAVNQRRFLKGLAHEPPGVKPFASAFTRRYGLRSASNAQRAVAALLERDVIEPDNGSFVIIDRFFKIWIGWMNGTAG